MIGKKPSDLLWLEECLGSRQKSQTAAAPVAPVTEVLRGRGWPLPHD